MENEIDTSSFDQKLSLKMNYFESNAEEAFDMKNKFRTKNLPQPISIRQAVSKYSVDIEFSGPSLIKNTAHVDFHDNNFDNVLFVQVNSLPAVREHLSPKNYVHEAVPYNLDEPSLLRLDLDKELKKDEQDFIFLNSPFISPRTVIETPTKLYFDSLCEEK